MHPWYSGNSTIESLFGRLFAEGGGQSWPPILGRSKQFRLAIRKLKKPQKRFGRKREKTEATRRDAPGEGRL